MDTFPVGQEDRTGRLKFSPSLSSNKIKHFETASAGINTSGKKSEQIIFKGDFYYGT